ncbi:MAG TPA: MBOAT family O-acyltransferase, partial [Planctomycetota bacterium]|nr:MBOAT family O-acyltransferase [Planctomycetota bacterium]
IGSEARPARRRAVLVASSVFQLGLLAWFKYSGFLAETVRDVAALLGLDGPGWPAVVLPLGISFYTFQILSSTIDVYRRRIEPCRDLALYALYVAYFPQLVAGPIERAAQLLPQLRATRPAGLAELSNGGRLVLWGLVKKGVLADRLAPSMRAFVEAPERHSSAELLVGTFLMMAVLYLDFSAYTDIARGSARLFGVELVENFRRTFLVTENRQFWNRWHMSLGRWLGDYVHAPLSKGVPTYASIWRNTLIVMGLFGLWHGAGWNFVALGFTVGSLIAFEHSLQLWRYRRGRRAKPARGPAGAAAGFAWTMLLNSAILVLFFAPDLRGALDYYRCLLPVDPGALRLGGDAPWIALAVAGLF